MDLAAGQFGPSGPPQLVMDAATGTVAAVFAINSPSGFQLMQVRTRPVGGAWGPASTISLDNGNAALASAAFTPQGELVVAWSRSGAIVDGGHSRVEVRVRAIDDTWGDIVQLSAVGHDGLSPLLSVSSSGTAVVAWDEAGFVTASTRSSGGGWTNPTALSSADDISPHVWLVEATAAGEAFVGWDTWMPQYSKTMKSRVRSSSGVWGPPTDLFSRGQTGNTSEIVSDDVGKLTLLWTADDGAVSIRDRPALGVWSDPVAIGDASSGGGDYGAQPYESAEGDLTVVWQASAGLTTDIRSRTRLNGGSWGATDELSLNSIIPTIIGSSARRYGALVSHR